VPCAYVLVKRGRRPTEPREPEAVAA